MKSAGLFQKRPDSVSFLIVLLHTAFVFLPLYLAASRAPGWHLVFFSLWFGIGMNGLLNLLHECAHLHVFRKPGASVFLGRWILGPLVLADFDGYQKRHWDHHRDLGRDTDPKYVYRQDIRGKNFASFLLRCLLLPEAAKKFSVQTPSAQTAPSNGKWWVPRALLAQAVLFGTIYVTALATAEPKTALWHTVAAYVCVYIYGIAAITVFVSSLRAIAEHQIGDDGAWTTGNAALRNFSFGCFSGFLLGAYGFKDHASHHQEPGIPYYHLPEKTRELAAENRAFAPAAPYEKVLFSLVKKKTTPRR